MFQKSLKFLVVCFLVWSCDAEKPVYKVQNQVSLAAQPVGLSHVRLKEGVFQEAQKADAQWLLDLEPDRLLHRYRLYAGLEPKGAVYGGWESRGISGHSLGHYLTACALMYAATDDQVYKERVDYIIDELALCQKAHGNGYVGAIPEQDRIWSEVAAGDIRSQGFDLNGGWVPWYTQHKLWAGLIDAFKYTGNDEALSVVIQLTDWAYETFSGLTEAQFQEMLACEHGGMNESLAELYAITGNEDYLKLSESFNHQEVFEPLSRREDDLSGKHANTQIPKIIGAARQYELTGNTVSETVASYFFQTVVDHHSYANGGNSEYEHFGQPDLLSSRLSMSTSETCNTYNMLKLAQHLQTWGLNSQRGDYIEKALFNHILASQNPESGMVAYFIPLNTGGYKEYGTPFDSFWCCVGSGMENHAKYGAYIFYETKDKDLVIDQYLAADLDYKDWDVEISTEFPKGEQVGLLVNSLPKGQTIQFRRPSWANELSVSVNGKSVKISEKGNGYFSLGSILSAGDRIELNFPMGFRMEAMPDDASKRALFYGPTLMAGVLDSASFPSALDYPVFVTEASGPASWLDQSEGLKARTVKVGRPADVTFKPFYELIDEKYLIYLDFYDEASWEKRKKEVAALKRKEEDIRRRTIDILRVGEMQPERDHQLEGENTISGEAFGRKWRHAENGGWFSFVMKVEPTVQNKLSVTYWGGDAGNREFDILIDGKKLASQVLERNRPDEFYEEYYTIPLSWIKGKQEVAVRFQAKPGKTAGGVYGVRMMKSR